LLARAGEFAAVPPIRVSAAVALWDSAASFARVSPSAARAAGAGGGLRGGSGAGAGEGPMLETLLMVFLFDFDCGHRAHPKLMNTH
jgi:hypothetical protein